MAKLTEEQVSAINEALRGDGRKSIVIKVEGGQTVVLLETRKKIG